VYPSVSSYSLSFNWQSFVKKQNPKFKTLCDFGGFFNHEKVILKNSENRQISIFGFQCVAKNIEI